MKININKKNINKWLYLTGLTLSMVSLSACGKKNIKQQANIYEEKTYDYDDEIVDIDELDEDTEYESEENKEIYLNKSSELSKYFDESVSFNDVRDAINNNYNLEEKDKENIIKVVDKLEDKTPSIDLRCLYENCKMLNIERKDNNEDNPNTLAYFNPETHIMTLYSDDMHYLSHEVLHMLNLLYINLDDENINIILDARRKDNKITFLLEGFIEWFNLYLFDYEDKNAYPVQYNDISIFKYILNMSNSRLISAFTNSDYTGIKNSFGEILDKEELNDLFSICENSVELFNSGKKDNKDDIKKKYDLLLKACINSREYLDSDSLYQIMLILKSSYINYYENNTDITNEYFNKLVNLSYNKNNSIKLYDGEGNIINYCDIDNMYFIGTEGVGYRIAESFRDENGKKKYYLNTKNKCYNVGDDDVVAPITALLNDNQDEVEIGDLMDRYEEIENGATYQKVK